MFARFLGRRVAALVVALGVFLSVAVPAWAGVAMSCEVSMSSGMSMVMPGMNVSNDCMGCLDKNSPGKQAPCKSIDGSCTVCSSCAINVGLAPNFSPVTLLYHRSTDLLLADAKPDGLTTAPALPPPILRA